MKAICLSIMLFVVTICGCNNSNGLTSVTGTVTFDQGPCPAPGSLSFTPIGDNVSRRSASAPFDVDGKFSVTSKKPGDGLLPGRYKVNVFCTKGDPNPAKNESWDDVSYVAKGYKPEPIEVVAGEPLELNLDIPGKELEQ